MIPAHNYIHIEYWMTELDLRPIQVWIYAIIHGFCQDGISTYKGSQRYFREWTHSARSTVIEALHDMESKHLIVSKEIQIGAHTYKEYYTVASRAVYQEMADTEKKNKKENKKSMSENRTSPGPENGHPLSENQTDPRPNSGPNNIANNIFKNAADSTEEEQEKLDGAAAALISKKLKELFGTGKVFDSDFVYEIEKVLLDSGVGEQFIDRYLQSVFEKTISKNPSSIPALFRKLACAPDVVQDFVLKIPEKREEENSVPEIECPVCGGRSPINASNCCSCGFEVMDFKDTRKIALQRAILTLPAEEQEEIEKQVANVLVGANLMDFMRPDKIKERNEKLVKIYAEHGIKYEL